MTRVLVVEDEMLVALYLRSLLEELGCDRVEVACDRAGALMAAERLVPQLVIADVNLGGGSDGLQAARQIAERYDAAIIFVTGNGDVVRQQFFDKVVALLEKPLNPQAFKAAVSATL